jgi:hypothetical protein
MKNILLITMMCMLFSSCGIKREMNSYKKPEELKQKK